MSVYGGRVGYTEFVYDIGKVVKVSIRIFTIPFNVLLFEFASQGNFRKQFVQ